jgi:hypothetical protein
LKAVSKAQRAINIAPKSTRKQNKSTPLSSSHQIADFCEKLFIAIPSLRTPSCGSPKCSDFNQEIGVERNMEPNPQTIPDF